MAITGRQIKAARGLAGLSQAKLAVLARVSIGTVRRIEDDPEQSNALVETMRRIQEALESMGVEFIDHERQGVQLRQAL